MEYEIKEHVVQVNVKPDLLLEGTLNIPDNARGIVLFAHGSGSSRHSPRNQFVAHSLNLARLGTLLLDLLTPDEEAVDSRTGHLRFDINLLAARLEGAVDWLTKQNDTRPLNIGLFGASTGAAAALEAAAHRSSLVSAVVSRGGRPDLAMSLLPDVLAPTLLIVGGNDEPVIEFNQQAMTHLHTTKRLEIVPGATHLFEEPGTLEAVAKLAQNWFVKYLSLQA
jgi:putative phosphoribosyl transferase